MIKYTKSDILRYHRKIVAMAYKALARGDIEQTMQKLALSAKVAYKFNYLYADSLSEELIHVVSKNIFPNIITFTPIVNRYVFIDTNGRDYHGLTQQYLHALIELGAEIIYVYKDPDHSHIENILGELRAYSRADIILFDQYTLEQQTQKIIEVVSQYKPQKIFLHIMPWDVSSLVACALLSNVERYNINLTDHAFWLGATCIDYNIEFRNYGYSVSIDKRGLRPEQLLKLPYYPIEEPVKFKGFPIELNKDQVVIFSGGAFYKVYGKQDAYFKILERIVLDNPNAVIFYAGSGNGEKMRQYIVKHHLQDRIMILNYRADISQVIRHSDIYLGTYPLCGGLMSQYAAINGKPILSYTDPVDRCNYIEGIICHMKDRQITITDTDLFFDYAKSLCSDKSLREQVGQEMRGCVISVNVFASKLHLTLQNNKTQDEFKYENINYEEFATLYLDVENIHLKDLTKLLVISFKFRLIYLFPKAFVILMTQLPVFFKCKTIKTKLRNWQKH